MRGFFWETLPDIPVFSNAWFDSLYMLMSVHGGKGYFTLFCVKERTRTLRFEVASGRISHISCVILDEFTHFLDESETRS